MAYKIYLINLDRAAGRLQAMKKKFGVLNLMFERISACDGRALSQDEKTQFAKSRPRANGWLAGAIGCFRSHHQVWSAIAEGKEEFGVVFEDDVHISAILPAVLSDIALHLDAFDVLRLEATKHRVLLNQSKVIQLVDTRLIEVRSEAWGAASYVLPKKTAIMLLAEPMAHHSPVDFFLFDKGSSAFARQHRIYQAVPALCVQSKFDEASIVNTETSYGSDIEHNVGYTRLRHLVRKIGWRINGFKNLLRGYRRIALAQDIVRL